MKIRFLRADPAGNITLFVITPVEKKDRAAIAARLMQLPEYQAEQVGFLCPPECGAMGRMERMGGEFCGNATRSYGMLLSREHGFLPRVEVEVSGMKGSSFVDVDWENHTARAEMPVPASIRPVKAGGAPAVLVDLGGIAHLIVENQKPRIESFEAAEPVFAETLGRRADAVGVNFIDRGARTLTPVVKVYSTDTVVFEGSCASGTISAASALCADMAEGTFSYTFREPSGILTGTVVKRNGIIVRAYIGGPVSLGEPVEEEI